MEARRRSLEQLEKQGVGLSRQCRAGSPVTSQRGRCVLAEKPIPHFEVDHMLINKNVQTPYKRTLT